MKSYRVVFVEWEDTCAPRRVWLDEEEFIARCIVKTVGILVRNEPKEGKIELAMGVDPLKGKFQSAAIPRGCIRKMITIARLRPWRVDAHA